MANCRDCKLDLPNDAKFCPNCGTQVGVDKDIYHVSGDGLIGKVKEILNDAKVKRVVIKDDKGKVLLSIPVTWGAASAAAPFSIIKKNFLLNSLTMYDGFVY